MTAEISEALNWAASEYRANVIAARCSTGGDMYLTCNGRAEAYRQLADKVADTAGLPRIDWEAIKRDVPADGIHR